MNGSARRIIKNMGVAMYGWVVGDISGDASRLGHVGSKFFPKGASWFTSFDMVARFAYE